MITLFLGGARSGKSDLAEARAGDLAGPQGTVTYVATIWPAAGDLDADLRQRVEAHRRRRPEAWRTVEPPYELAPVLADTRGVVLVDSLGSWLSAQPDMAADLDALVDALRSRTEPTVLVTDEVGLGVHPETALGREFRDALGTLNRRVADVAADVYLVVAGRLLRTERP